jgi:amidase
VTQPPSTTEDLVKLTAREAVDLLRKREVSPLELVDAALDRVEQVDGDVNALPTVAAERAREHARRLMREGHPAEPPRGYLYGLPIAIKDLKDVEGVRSTRGSLIFADHVPNRSDHLVLNLESKGGVVLAKSNTPEFGAGANTFNEVFGKTRNPWDTRMTCGGSSGGSAVALATGQVWLATGSDLGGSLRIPASFCSVVGLRPTPGRVAHGPKEQPFATLSVEGPMGRTVGDTALHLDAQAGQHPVDPISFAAPERPFIDAVDEPVPPKRVAYTPDLGFAPVDAEVREVCGRAMKAFEAMGASVDEATIDLHDAEDIFQTLRASSYAASYARYLGAERDLLKPEIVWNVEKGLALSAADVSRAETARGALYQRTAAFFERYDLLVCPAVLVPPFDVDQRYVTEASGVTFDTYVSWLVMSFALTLTACPAISVPCGFTASGLPVGLQIMAPRADEALLLSAAALFEQASGLASFVPIDPLVRHERGMGSTGARV